MNEILSNFARKWLKYNIRKLPKGNHLMFKRMYSHKNLDVSIDDIIDNMHEDKLDWAMEQVQNSIEKIMQGK